MRKVNATKLKRQLRKYLTLAKAGEEIIISRRNAPVAKLVPFSSIQVSEEELILVAKGIMRLPTRVPDVDGFLRMPIARVSGNKAVEVLRKEREST